VLGNSVSSRRNDRQGYRIVKTVLSLVLIYAAIVAVPAFSAALEPNDCEQEVEAARAVRACSQLLERSDLGDDVRSRLLIKRGFAWLDEDEPKEAVADFSRAIKIAPGDGKALMGRARAHTSAGDHKQAALDWSAIIEKNATPADLEANYLARAASWLAAGDTQAALADYAKVLDLNPKSIKALIGRANVYVAGDDRTKALAEFSRAMAIDPGNTAPYIARAEAAERWGDNRMAIEDYKFVVKNNSRSAGPYRQALKRLGVDTPP
jgi:Tfp pilus assembly protein PilF